MHDAFSALLAAAAEAAAGLPEARNGQDVRDMNSTISFLLAQRLLGNNWDLRGHTAEYLQEFQRRLLSMASKDPGIAEQEKVAETTGLFRQGADYGVDVGWRNFRLKATHIPNLELALAIHVACAGTRLAAQARYNDYVAKAYGSSVTR